MHCMRMLGMSDCDCSLLAQDHHDAGQLMHQAPVGDHAMAWEPADNATVETNKSLEMWVCGTDVRAGRKR